MNLDTTQLMAIAAGLGWASGLRLYAVVFLTGMAGFMGWVDLPQGLQLLQHPLMLGASGLMLFAEFFADKIPGIDTIWDVVHTVIRIPAGAALAAVLGGMLAATSHVAKASTRAAANTSPEPFSNIGLSLLGDGAVPVMLWLSWQQPLVFFGLLLLALVVMVVLIWVFAKFLRQLLRLLSKWLGVSQPST